MLQGAESGGESCSDKDSDRLGLTKVVALTPSLESQDNGSDSFFYRRHLGLLLRRKELLDRCRRHRMRRRASYFPLLKRAELHGQPGLNQGSNCLRLTEIVNCSPG